MAILPAPFHQIPVDRAGREHFAHENRQAVIAALAAEDPPVDEALLSALLPLTSAFGPHVDPEIHLHAARIAAGVRAPFGSPFAKLVAREVHALFRAYDAVPDDATRQMLATAAAREDTYTHGERLFFVVYALDEAPELADRLLRSTTTKDLEVARRVLHAVLLHGEPHHAVAALFGGGLGSFAAELWADIPEERRGTLLPAIVEGAILGPSEVPALLLRETTDHPELGPFTRWFLEHGEPTEGAPTAPRGRPDPVAEGRVAEVVAAAPDDPWSAAERQSVHGLPTEEVVPLVARAATMPLSGPARRRALRQIQRVCTAAALDSPESEERWCEMAVRGSLTVEVTGALLRAIPAGGRLSKEMRARFAEAAAASDDPPFGLLRLGLPGTHAAWRAWMRQHQDIDEVRTWDQSFLLALPPEEAAPLLRPFYADLTPNQRRAMMRAAELGQRPEHIPALLDVAVQLDVSMADALLARLSKLVSRHKAVGTYGIDAVRKIVDLPTLRKAAVAFLEEAGAVAHAGSVSLTTTDGALSTVADGGLSLADEVVGTPKLRTPTPAAPSFVQTAEPGATSVRPGLDQLSPPPRWLSRAVWWSMLATNASGWGGIWFLLVCLGVFSIVDGSLTVVEAARVSAVGLGGGLVHHAFAGTWRQLTALRRGVLAVARSSAELITEEGRRTERRWRHTLRYLGDDGKPYSLSVVRAAKQLHLSDDDQEPLLVVSDRDGRPETVVILDTIRNVRVAPDGHVVLSGRGRLALLFTVIPMVAMALGTIFG